MVQFEVLDGGHDLDHGADRSVGLGSLARDCHVAFEQCTWFSMCLNSRDAGGEIRLYVVEKQDVIWLWELALADLRGEFDEVNNAKALCSSDEDLFLGVLAELHGEFGFFFANHDLSS